MSLEEVVEAADSRSSLSSSVIKFAGGLRDRFGGETSSLYVSAAPADVLAVGAAGLFEVVREREDAGAGTTGLGGTDPVSLSTVAVLVRFLLTVRSGMFGTCWVLGNRVAGRGAGKLGDSR